MNNKITADRNNSSDFVSPGEPASNGMKTIFINLFSILAVDNFCIPDGVMDLLVKNKAKEDKIVILTAEAFKEKLLPYTADPLVTIEIINTYPPKGFVQKAFHFFYAFLIFTGSTKILATFGARADVPPAGGNPHLWIFKALIANTFGRSKFIKKKFTPWLYNRIFRKRPYKNLFEKYSPNLVVVPGLAFFPDIEICAEAQRQKVRSVGMVMNWDHLNKYYIPIHSDILLVQNEPMKKEAIKWHAYDEDQIRLVGFPQFDMYVHPDKFLIPKSDFLKTFNLGDANKIILFISGAAYSKDEPDILKAISASISEGVFGKNVKLLVRPYVIVRDLEREQEKYKQFLDDKNMSFNWLRRTDNLDNKKIFMSMLAYSDVVISIFSTTAIESAVFDKPTITIGFDGSHKRPYRESIRRLEDMSHFKNVLDTGSVKISRSFDDLKGFIKDYLVDPSIDRDDRKVLVNKMCFKNDGKSSIRVVDNILASNNDK